MKKFADIILPLPVRGLFTYALPESIASNIQVGCRVIVPFGTKKFFTGIIRDIHENEPQGYVIKEVQESLENNPILYEHQLRLWEWISDYYLCALGDVYKAALPAGLKLESETIVELNTEYTEEEEEDKLGEKELFIIGLLEKGASSLTKLSKEAKYANITDTIKCLMEKDIVMVKEELKSSFKPKKCSMVRLSNKFQTEQQLHLAYLLLAKSDKQTKLFNTYLELSGYAEGNEEHPVSKANLIQKSGCSAAILKGIIDKGILEVYEIVVNRIHHNTTATKPVAQLSTAQTQAFKEIKRSFESKNICLFQGVTASGKTEVYIHLIQEYLQQGKQVLYLLPEIALTTQITERLKRVFGDKLGIYHSKFPDTERVEIWRKQLSKSPYSIILGVRSSIFLPFQNLGLIIVDEEHETSYKQQDPAPRYNAKNVAMIMGNMLQAKVLLGTATPSIESWYNAQSGKYGYVLLDTRYKEVQLPEIIPVDIKELIRKHRMRGSFSPMLAEQIEQVLQNGEQIILFQNRRGFAPMIECHTCGWVPKCKQCDVSLTYHKKNNQLVCHYCGYTEAVPLRCPACNETDIRHRGVGTERIEDEITTLFPSAKVARMDLDTTRTRTAYEKIIEDFEQHKTDILIGTQMISKGLDFDHVHIVGILNADTLLNYPDFRAHERAFQLLAQVAGRAGRKGKQGKVILQTKSIDHDIIDWVMQNNYEAMVREQLNERKFFKYPPFYRLIYVFVKHKKENTAELMAQSMAVYLRQGFGERVLGPEEPPVARIQTWYIRKIMLKLEHSLPATKVREVLINIQENILKDDRFKSGVIYYDVDPM